MSVGCVRLSVTNERRSSGGSSTSVHAVATGPAIGDPRACHTTSLEEIFAARPIGCRRIRAMTEPSDDLDRLVAELDGRTARGAGW